MATKNVQLQHLLGQMTTKEKIGQLVQVTPSFFKEVEGTGIVTGLMGDYTIPGEDIYEVGSVLGSYDRDEIQSIQEAYLKKNRLKIPLLFMADVIHGIKTIFPIPLAIASTFNTETAKEMTSWSAIECQEAGVHITFSPMVDLMKDARWGRVMEGTGEDPYLNTQMAKAFVEGYQGAPGELKTNYEKIGSCVKHFVGYGAVEAGREYNHVALSKLDIYQNHLAAFQAAIDAGTTLVMTAFNTIDGIPAVGNKKLIRDLLREEMGFSGPIIADWGAINQLITHGVAEDQQEATQLAIESGCDIDMMTNSYYANLEELITTGKVDAALLDEAVLRVLILKDQLGLFEDPFRGSKKIISPKTLGTEIQEVARKVSQESIVLLKNEGLLPITKKQSVAFIGPKVATQDVLGSWCGYGNQEEAVSLESAVQNQFENGVIVPIDSVHHLKKDELQQAIEAAKNHDIILLALGEESEESGEAASKTKLTLPDSQQQLIKELAKVNPAIITVLYNGRPLDLSGVEEYSQAIVETWFLGTQSGNAIMDILLGEVNPSGKLPMTFPISVGQVPIYYNHMNTGNPLSPERANEKYISKYLDAPNTPRYPFGYGLSYTTFDLSTQAAVHREDHGDTIHINCQIKNSGHREGAEVVQVYVRDYVGQVTRPVRELKKFEKVWLKPNEEKTIQFILTENDLSYYNSSVEKVRDKGRYGIFVGTDSLAPLVTDVIL